MLKKITPENRINEFKRNWTNINLNYAIVYNKISTLEQNYFGYSLNLINLKVNRCYRSAINKRSSIEMYLKKRFYITFFIMCTLLHQWHAVLWNLFFYRTGDGRPITPIVFILWLVSHFDWIYRKTFLVRVT